MHGPSTRGKLLIAALVVGLLGGLLSLFSPLMFAQTFYFSRETIFMLIPVKNFVLLFTATLAVIGTLVLLAFIRKRWSYFIATLLIALSLGATYSAFVSITLIEEDGLVIRDVFTKQDYMWEDVYEVTYYYTAATNEGVYAFTLDGGKEVSITETALLDEHKKQLLRNVFERHSIVYHTVSY